MRGVCQGVRSHTKKKKKVLRRESNNEFEDLYIKKNWIFCKIITLGGDTPLLTSDSAGEEKGTLEF